MATMLPTPVATRMPFGEINGSRLQNLTSMKNRQNAINSLASPTKRKAQTFEADIDAENIDPSFFSPKRSKGSDFSKPQTQLLVKPTPTRQILTPRLASTSFRASTSTPRLNIKTGISATLSAPAGRSPTKKRAGILNRRRTIQRIDPPTFNLSSKTSTAAPAPFSLSAALAGTIPSYQAKAPLAAAINPPKPKAQPALSSQWDFVIHEDTPEEEAQILMLHGACTLDISSDEETARRERCERGKENFPPLDDISQSQARLPRADHRRSTTIKDVDACDVDRSPLGDLDTRDFLADGVSADEVILIHDEDDDDFEEVSDPTTAHSENVENKSHPQEQIPSRESSYEFSLEVPVKGKGRALQDVDDLMAMAAEGKALLLQPVEKAEEGWSVWESGSAKGDE